MIVYIVLQLTSKKAFPLRISKIVYLGLSLELSHYIFHNSHKEGKTEILVNIFTQLITILFYVDGPEEVMQIVRSGSQPLGLCATVFTGSFHQSMSPDSSNPRQVAIEQLQTFGLSAYAAETFVTLALSKAGQPSTSVNSPRCPGRASTMQSTN
jgi:hypothetical protein